MRLPLFLRVPVLALALLGSIGTSAFSEAFHDMKSLDWLQMSMGGRMEHLVVCMGALNENGVPFQKSPEEYYTAMYEKITMNPDLYYRSVSSVLASIVYESEPGSHEALDRIREDQPKGEPKVKKIEMH